MKPLATILPLLTVAETAKVVSLNIARDSAAAGKIRNTRGLVGKRSGTIAQELMNNVSSGSYLASVQIGTPPQPVTLAIDTGSSDVWVVSSDANICFGSAPSTVTSPCVSGTFNSSASSTFDDIIPDGFVIIYEDHTTAEGDYFTDNLSVGNVTVSKLQMGLGNGQTNIAQGILGIGYDTDEASQGVTGGKQYPNFIDQLVSQNLINTKAYSLWLDDLEASTGSVLFGGMDTAKFTGPLTKLPIQADSAESGTSNITSFTVSLARVTASAENGTMAVDSHALSTPVFLDSGTTLTYLPRNLTEPIYDYFGVVNDMDESGMIVADCTIGSTSSHASLNFQLGDAAGPTIAVNIQELLFPVSDDAFASFDIPTIFEQNCMFGIYPKLTGPYILGDTFLRSAYVVYDLKNNEIAIARSAFNSDESNIIEFAASASGLPEVSGFAVGSSPTSTATDRPVVSDLPIVSSGSATVVVTGASSPALSSGVVSSASTVSSSSASSGSSSSASAASQSSSVTASSSSAAGSMPASDGGILVVFGALVVSLLVGGAWVIL